MNNAEASARSCFVARLSTRCKVSSPWRSSNRAELTTLSVTHSVARRVDLVVVVGVAKGLAGIAAAVGDDVVADVTLGCWGLCVSGAVGSACADGAAVVAGGVDDGGGQQGEVAVEGERADLVAGEGGADLVADVALCEAGRGWGLDGDGCGQSGDGGECRGGGGRCGRGHGDDAGSVGWDDSADTGLRDSDGADDGRSANSDCRCDASLGAGGNAGAEESGAGCALDADRVLALSTSLSLGHLGTSGASQDWDVTLVSVGAGLEVRLAALEKSIALLGGEAWSKGKSSEASWRWDALRDTWDGRGAEHRGGGSETLNSSDSRRAGYSLERREGVR